MRVQVQRNRDGGMAKPLLRDCHDIRFADLNQTGAAIGVVVTNQGPHPRSASHLPGWLLR
jgi:hypothetical protein